MKKIEVYSKVKELHEEIVDEIKQMMTWNRKAVVDLAGSQAPHAFIVGVPDFDADMDYVEAEVMAVILEDGRVKLDINWDIDTDDYLDSYPNKNGDISALYPVIDAMDFGNLLPCAGISSVYEAVWEYLTCGYKGDRDKDIE